MKAGFVLDIASTRANARSAGGFPQLSRFAAEYLIGLPVGAIAGLIWANVDAETYYRLAPLLLGAVGTASVLRRRKVKSFWPYVIVCGGLSWSALFFGGFHPALALLPIVPFLPHAARDPGFFVDATPRDADTLNRFELWCRHPVQAIAFCFGLVNAGVPFSALEAGVWSLPVASLVGKPLGLLAGVAFGTAIGFHLPRGVHWRDLVPLGFITATGFTMALFFATASIGPGQMLAELKMGATISIAGCFVAIAVARVFRAGRFGP